MSSEKTEEATPRRRNKERQRGNIAKSRDMEAALVITAGIVLLFSLGAGIGEKIKNYMFFVLTNLDPNSISTDNISLIFMPVFKFLSVSLFPFMCILMLLAIVLIRSQTGNIFALDKIKPKLDKIKPTTWMQGLKKIINPFEPKNMVELLKSILKMLIVGYCGYITMMNNKDELFGLVGVPLEAGFGVLVGILIKMLVNMCLALIVLGYFDKKYQTYEFNKSIKMSKQEVKDEYKNLEGDPKVKSKIKSIQMKFAQQRMMANVPQADVVVTNPTHFAVALKYDTMKNKAPVVVAKGIDFLAFKIREIAQNNNIPIVENRPLARALYKLVPVDGIIPAELYTAVAEVLAWVYRRNQNGIRG